MCPAPRLHSPRHRSSRRASPSVRSAEARPGTAEILTSPLLSALPWLRHGFSTRRGATPGQDFDLARSVRNQRAFVRALTGAARSRPASELIQLRQIHSDLVWLDPEAGCAGDALLSRQAGRLLAVRTADCCPILLADTRLHAVAAVHAGWRGTLARVSAKAVGEMQAAFGTDPADLVAAVGPSIRGCCYEVGEEVVGAFQARFDRAGEWLQSPEDDPVRSRYPMLFMTGAPPGHPYDPRWNREAAKRLDLALANRHQLERAGVPAAAIDVLPFCTHCHPDRFFSHRAGAQGRMLAAIGVAPIAPAAH